MMPSKRGLSKYRSTAATSCSNGVWGAASASTMAIAQHYGGRLSDSAESSTASGCELLTTVDVVGRAGESGVHHQVDGQCRHVGGGHHTTDRKRPAQLVSPLLESFAEQRRRQRRVDE